jgi:hypothetical protein
MEGLENKPMDEWTQEEWDYMNSEYAMEKRIEEVGGKKKFDYLGKIASKCELRGREGYLLGFIVSLCDGNGIFISKVSSLSKYVKENGLSEITPRTMRGILDRLATKGALTIEKRKNGLNIFILSDYEGEPNEQHTH